MNKTCKELFKRFEFQGDVKTSEAVDKIEWFFYFNFSGTNVKTKSKLFISSYI